MLAAIVCEHKDVITSGRRRRVVALSTGTKCQPYNEEVKHRLIVDSHAESLLKRAFKRHLISLLDNNVQLDNILSVDLFVSQLPCGSVQRWKGYLQSDDKNVMTDKKPGRGELCLRATCLKKIKKWIYMGLQGKRLIQFTKRPILIKNIVIGNCGPIGEFEPKLLFDLLTLDDTCTAYHPFQFTTLPNIKFCDNFRKELFTRSESKQPCSTSIVSWITGIDRDYYVT